MSETIVPPSEKPFSTDDSVYLFLAYFGILSLIPFLMFRDQRSNPQKEYVYWHARQGLALSVVVVTLGICLTVVDVILGFIPFIGLVAGVFSCCFWPCYLLAALAAHILGWVKAFGGQKWEMPGVCKIAEMFK